MGNSVRLEMGAGLARDAMAGVGRVVLWRRREQRARGGLTAKLEVRGEARGHRGGRERGGGRAQPGGAAVRMRLELGGRAVRVARGHGQDVHLADGAGALPRGAVEVVFRVVLLAAAGASGAVGSEGGIVKVGRLAGFLAFFPAAISGARDLVLLLLLLSSLLLLIVVAAFVFIVLVVAEGNVRVGGGLVVHVGLVAGSIGLQEVGQDGRELVEVDELEEEAAVERV
mmetsp:Transcript_11038/g.35171  ORF Transcript_11038/g.35171 Transcript_11038/m.35171 type:complete len:227 (-) Transcript_11038:170-850(-)